MAQRLKAAERRASILAVAKLLFADRGYHGVAVDEIAHRLGVSPAVLYQHFPSKEALYEAVVDQLAGDRETYIEAALNGPDDFVSVLTRISLVFARQVATDPDLLRMEMHNALEENRSSERFIRNRWQAIRDYIEYNVQERTAGKLARSRALALALLYQGMLREVLYQKYVLQEPQYTELALEPLVQEAVGLLQRALAGDSAT